MVDFSAASMRIGVKDFDPTTTPLLLSCIVAPFLHFLAPNCRFSWFLAKKVRRHVRHFVTDDRADLSYHHHFIVKGKGSVDIKLDCRKGHRRSEM